MSYKTVPMCKCAMCGETEEADFWLSSVFGMTSVLKLPDGWTGSTRMGGDCYCEKCTRAIERMREEMGE